MNSGLASAMASPVRRLGPSTYLAPDDPVRAPRTTKSVGWSSSGEVTPPGPTDGTTSPESSSEQGAGPDGAVPEASVAPPGKFSMRHTGRNRNSAVVPTRARALSWSSTPGSETITPVSVREISGSATPRPSTRSRMISTVWSSMASSVGPTATSRTETPPWRSRPSRGSLRHTTVRTAAATVSATIPRRRTNWRRGIGEERSGGVWG